MRRARNVIRPNGLKFAIKSWLNNITYGWGLQFYYIGFTALFSVYFLSTIK